MVNWSRGRAKLSVLTIVWLLAESAFAVSVQPEGFNSVGLDLVRDREPNLTGQGTTIAVICRSTTYIDGVPQNDYKPDLAHHCLAQTSLSLYNDADPAAEASEHSTGICSLLFGKDSDAYEQSLGTFDYQGLVCDANAQVFEFWHFLKEQVFNNVRPQADVISVGVGSVFEDWWTRGIEAMAEQYATVVVAGIGNGAGAHDLPLYPAAGANVIAVGVLQPMAEDKSLEAPSRFSFARPLSSTGGPTEDGRCKPDLVAPGNYLVAVADEPNQYRPCGSYCSFAAPVIAGTAALLIQKAKANPDTADLLAGDSGNCVIKAILMNTAAKLPYWHKGKLSKDDDHEAPLDFMHGAGVLDAFAAYNTLPAGPQPPGEVSGEGWDLGTLRQQQAAQNRYRFALPEPNDKMITITVAWNRHYQKRYPFEPIPQRDTNLRLELWAVGDDTASNDVLLDYSDSKTDNVEHIYCAADPNHSRYEIVISLGDQTAPDGEASESYGIAWKLTGSGKNKPPAFYDLNGDGRVSKQDVTVLLENSVKCLEGPNDYMVGDINEDGTIDIKDVSSFVAQSEPNFE